MIPWDTLLSAGVLASVITVVANFGIAWFRSRQQLRTVNTVMMQKFGIASQKTLTDQFEALIRASESYREEVRNDMERLRTEHRTLHSKYENEIGEMKEFYEGEIAILRQRIATLTEEVISYRRENGALHLLLQQRGISVPDWVRWNQEDKG